MKKIAFLLLFISTSAMATIVRIQSSADTVPNVNPKAIAISASGSGNLIAVLFGTENGTNFVTGIIDNVGNTYHQALGAYVNAPSISGFCDVWYAANSISGATTITVTFNTVPGGGSMKAVEYSGIATVNPIVDVSGSSASITGGSHAFGPSLTIKNSNDLLVSAAYKFGSNPMNVSAPWTIIPTAIFHVFADLISPGSVGPYQVHYTPDANDAYLISSVAFFPTPLPTSCRISGNTKFRGNMNIL